jgi:hypothetical protein
MEKQFSFYDPEVSKLSMSGKTYWSEKPDVTGYPILKVLGENLEKTEKRSQNSPNFPRLRLFNVNPK